MKNIILILTILYSLGMYAQVGINNTDPKASLDVVSSTDNSQADGVLVPRLDRLALNDKDTGNAYGTDQEGALIYVDDASTGTATGETANVDAVGFYFYDSSNSRWTKAGGGTAADGSETKIQAGPNVTVSGTGTTADPYIVSSDKTDFTVGGIIDVDATNATQSDLTGNTTDNVVNIINADTFGNNSITLPSAASNSGRIILVKNNGGGAAILVTNAFDGTTLNNTRAAIFLSDGTTWVNIQ